jgi:hypothetical protein
VPSRGATQQLDAVERAWSEFREAVAQLSPQELERATPAGWTVKEMLAHVAFWEETVRPVFVGWFRAQPDDAFEGWYGGDDLGLARDDPWPVSDVHNAREAGWARPRRGADVLARLDRAHRQLVEVVGSLSEEEAQDDRYTGKIAEATWRHYAKHLPELAAVAAAGTADEP